MSRHCSASLAGVINAGSYSRKATPLPLSSRIKESFWGQTMLPRLGLIPFSKTIPVKVKATSSTCPYAHPHSFLSSFSFWSWPNRFSSSSKFTNGVPVLVRDSLLLPLYPFSSGFPWKNTPLFFLWPIRALTSLQVHAPHAYFHLLIRTCKNHIILMQFVSPLAFSPNTD